MFWMSRYVERAEGVTRLVEVNRDTNLEANPSRLSRLLEICTQCYVCLEDFAKDEIKDEEKFILFSDKWPSSLLTCINMARENGRMIRDQLSEEIWVELNNLIC